jgi:AcrR family transcriptional regulator
MQEASLTLRERNRLDTWNAVHAAAADLFLNDGPAAATIEAISLRAGVSKRTFFNYFPTKEDAVLGTRAPTLPDELLDKFRSSDADLLTRTVRILAGVLATSLDRGAAYQLRRRLVTAHPELKGRIMEHITAAEQLVDTVLRQRIADEEAAETISRLPAGHDSARALLMIAGTITRFAYATNPEGTVADIDAEIESAVTTFREVIKATDEQPN